MKAAQRGALGATALSFISQFFQDEGDSRGGVLQRATDEHYYEGVSFTGSAGGTGWDLQPHAWMIQTALAII